MVALAKDEIDYAAKLGDVRASVRPNLQVSRHIFSGVKTYVLRDPITAQSHRFSAEDYQLLIAIDQTRTLKQSLQALIDRKRLNESDSSKFYRYVVHLHQMGLLSLPLSDGNSLHKRYVQRQEAQKKGRLFKLLFMKVPLVKPDRFLANTQHWFAPLFTLQAVVVWLLCAILSLVVLMTNWGEFVDPVGTMLTLGNLPTLWCLLVGLKVFHEFGHAYACKIFKGDVPEMGAMFILGTPCAYVDASSSWGFASRWHRMTVALAGMYFESMLAMVALLVWLFTDTGHLHSAAQYAIVLSTVVTIGFNANPLMRYDGYFVLCDILNIPNLHREAKASAVSFIKRWLFWLELPESETSQSRRYFMTAFGLACMVYQITVSAGIAILLSFAIPLVGPAIGATMLLMPLVRQIRSVVSYLGRSDEVAKIRGRAVAIVTGMAASLIVIVFVVPIPGRTETLGILHRMEEQSIRAGVDGFVLKVLATSGTKLTSSQPIYRLENADLLTQRFEIQSVIDQLAIQIQSTMTTDNQAAELYRTKWVSEQEKLAHLDHRISQLDVVAPILGDFVEMRLKPKQGHYVKSGEPLGLVCRGPWVVKTRLSAEQWSSVVSKLDEVVDVKMVGATGQTLHGKIVQYQTSGSRKIDELGLTHSGGGNIAVTQEMMAVENFFELIVEVDPLTDPRLAQAVKLGMSAILSLPSNDQTLGSILYRRSMRVLNQFRLASS